METMRLHITQMVKFQNNFLHVSGPNDSFGMKKFSKGERKRLIIHIVLFPGHCLLFIFQ